MVHQKRSVKKLLKYSIEFCLLEKTECQIIKTSCLSSSKVTSCWCKGFSIFCLLTICIITHPQVSTASHQELSSNSYYILNKYISKCGNNYMLFDFLNNSCTKWTNWAQNGQKSFFKVFRKVLLLLFSGFNVKYKFILIAFCLH